MNLRSRATGIATGDQAIFVERTLFREVGGYPEQPLMEDIELSRRLKRAAGSPLCLRQRVVTSARRWERHDPWRTVVAMWRGASPTGAARARRSSRPIRHPPRIAARDAAGLREESAPGSRQDAARPTPSAPPKLPRTMSPRRAYARDGCCRAGGGHRRSSRAVVRARCRCPAFAAWRERFDVG